jgi:Tfp pilus assembly protein PilF
MQHDRYGLPLSTQSEAAASAYRDGFDRLLAAWSGAEEALDRAIALDPNFALAYIARARIYAIFGHGDEARTSAAKARDLVVSASERECGHVHIIASAIEGKTAQALADAERHVAAYPRDALVLLSLLGAFGLYAFSGRNDHDEARRSMCRKLAPYYGDDWWFLAYLGWSNIEAGYPGIGIEQAQRALALRPQNGHVAHILAHGYFEVGDAAAGNHFLSSWLSAHPRSGFMHWHLIWHRALLELELGDNNAALKTYEAHIRPAVSDAPPINVLADGASLLWRLALDGCEIPKADWNELADYGDRRAPRAGAHFIDLHYVLAAAVSDPVRFDKRVTELEALHSQGRLPPGAVAIAMCKAAQALAAGNNAQAIHLLEPLMPDVVRIGGSHAQRELWEDMLIVACLRSGESGKARALVDDRLHRRPSARDLKWKAALEAQ